MIRKMKLKQLILVMLMAVFVGMTSCEEGPSNVPTLPTSFSIEDGAIVEETNLILSAFGGTVEDEGYSVEYKYYLGTSVDDLRLVGIRDKQEVKLEPFTQYFFAVKPVSVHASDSIEGEMSEIRTFYCAPPLEIETDNGEGEWAAILRFKGLDIKGGTVSAKGDHEGYDIEPITIPAGQDSCYIPMTRHTLSQYNAYVQWWDDKIGQYYEPVIYTFEVSLDIQVGDKVIPVKNTAKEIILDKNSCVRDHEFNVYRVTKFGDQTWMEDTYRARSYINSKGEVVPFYVSPENPTNDRRTSAIMESKALSTGETSIFYGGYYEAPTIKGYRLPTVDDARELVDYIYDFYHLEKIDENYSNPESFDLVRSCEGWTDCTPLEEIMGVFNAKPFGFGKKLTYSNMTLFSGEDSRIALMEECDNKYRTIGFVMVDKWRGLYLYIDNLESNLWVDFYNIRLIKE